jgi:Domain of unknown function (DUF6398)
LGIRHRHGARDVEARRFNADQIGAVNFLFDPEQTPHLNSRELCALFGVSQTACAAKTREIRRIFDIVQLDPRWCLPSKLADNALVWMIEVNGILVDIRTTPRELQEEACRLGLIPLVPSASAIDDTAV